jgi:hypothetical protein
VPLGPVPRRLGSVTHEYDCHSPVSTSSTFAQRLRAGTASLQSVMHSRQVSVVHSQSPTYSIDPEESIKSMTAGRISRMSGCAATGDAPGHEAREQQREGHPREAQGAVAT